MLIILLIMLLLIWQQVPGGPSGSQITNYIIIMVT